ncbi:DUF1566 domain-containing protein [Burkholderia lata]|uniref:DUF1566 domain-containing protein n=1 Tax=Burkholderia lata (strain ATCC 17760 / DSM 23089 / LMG 22485 / NCIMB 9086 / R18194 / 383) TaxID=482957 RepID=A0A6P2GU48_BURL3|nr:DUF1566 domain-containing protein [Burkholderia lata]VWB07966.1 hypothetical protein BLA6863_00194 [Burkholderia lata]
MNQVTVLTVPPLGTIWEEQGGIYVGIMPGIKGGPQYHLIASEDEAESLQFGGYGTRVEGANSTVDGIANTTALLRSGIDYPAAAWASKYEKNGVSGFYLPAQRELNLAYVTAAELFDDDWYWSSTQYSALSAWHQHFDVGYQHRSDKLDYGRVRAFRRLFI